MEYKIFKQRSQACDNEEFAKIIVEQFKISMLTASLLVKKGFTSLGQIEEYLFPKQEHLHNPLFFRDMQKAVDRIKQAKEKKEKIVIYGDYDCDGVCASVILYKALTAFGCLVETFLPDRFSDGYGMNMASLSKIIDNGANLIITVDNGITASAEIQYAQDRHVDVILSDHHTCPDVIPNAYAVIDPKMKDETYPYHELCGAAVSLKIATALCTDDLDFCELIIFAAIATVADLVPLTGENRTIVSLGLKYIKENRNIGLKYLIETSSLKSSNINSGNISFQIAPRINAVGRLYCPNLAFELFVTHDEARAIELAKKLNEANNERKIIEQYIVEKSEQIILDKALLNKQSVLFIRLEDENEGVIGIAAGKLCEKYNRPVIVACTKDHIVKASARSIASFDIYEALAQGNEYYIKFGGHSQAAGFSIDEKYFDRLAEIVNQYAENLNIKALFYKRCYYDIEAVSSLITEKAVREVELFAPFGIKNPHPVYKLENINLRNLTKIGSTKEHLRCNVLHKACNFEAVGFSMGHIADTNHVEEERYDLLFTPSINTYKQKNTIQLEIKDIDFHSDFSQDYYVSLYNHFMYNFNSAETYHPLELNNITPEAAFEAYSDSIFITYGKDALARANRYASFKLIEAVMHYGTMNEFKTEKMNILINPVTKDLQYISNPVIVLDKPCFFDYEKRLYDKFENATFLKTARYVPDVLIDRDFIAFIYKKLKILNALGQNFSDFINYINNDSERDVNYFNLRISLDIMSEMGILEYEIISGKLYIEFKKISGQKDINQSEIMLKLISIDAKKQEVFNGY